MIKFHINFSDRAYSFHDFDEIFSPRGEYKFFKCNNFDLGYRRNKGAMIKRLGGRGTRMDWKDTSRDKMEAVGCAEASITVKTELFLGLDEDVRTNWNRTSCLSRRICFSTKIQWHVGNISCCTSFAHFRLRFIFILERWNNF